MLVEASVRLAKAGLDSRLAEVGQKKEQKMFDIYARVDRGKRDIHCAKRWAAAVHENLWAETRGAVQRLASDLANRITNVMTNPAKACDLAIERSFAQRDWKKVVMYSINPTQFLFYEFHGEWEEIKTGLLHRSCKDLRAGYAECLATLETKLADITTGETVNTVSDLVANQCAAIADPSLKHLTTYVVPRMPPEANYAISDPEKFASFATAALRGYRAESEEANQNLEQLIDKELLRQKH